MHVAEPKLVHERWRKQVSLCHVEKTRAHRCVKWKIQRRRADAARQRAPERLLQVASAEGKQALRIREEEACGEFVLAAVEFTVPVGSELIIGVGTRLAQREGSRVDVSSCKARCAP